MTDSKTMDAQAGYEKAITTLAAVLAGGNDVCAYPGSVGSLIGALYAAEPNTFELEWKSFKLEKDDIFDFSLLSAATGPVKGEAIKAFPRQALHAAHLGRFVLNSFS